MNLLKILREQGVEGNKELEAHAIAFAETYPCVFEEYLEETLADAEQVEGEEQMDSAKCD